MATTGDRLGRHLVPGLVFLVAGGVLLLTAGPAVLGGAMMVVGVALIAGSVVAARKGDPHDDRPPPAS